MSRFVLFFKTLDDERSIGSIIKNLVVLMCPKFFPFEIVNRAVFPLAEHLWSYGEYSNAIELVNRFVREEESRDKMFGKIGLESIRGEMLLKVAQNMAPDPTASYKAIRSMKGRLYATAIEKDDTILLCLDELLKKSLDPENKIFWGWRFLEELKEENSRDKARRKIIRLKLENVTEEDDLSKVREDILEDVELIKNSKDHISALIDIADYFLNSGHLEEAEPVISRLKFFAPNLCVFNKSFFKKEAS